ncbi:MAG TPA: Spy/CpxP family protein refolding chaperone [Gemmatimonadaceae bacterium]
MKVFRIAALGVALLAGSTAIAGAQNAAPPAPSQQGGPGGGRGGMNRTLNGIELTDAQKAKVAEIQAKYQPEMQAIRESMQGGGDRAEAFQKMSALRDKMSPEIRAVLTPAQQAIYDKNVADQKARMEQMRQGRGPGR